MADDQSMTTVARAGKLPAGEHADVLRDAVRIVLVELMEAEVAELAGAERYERCEERASYRNGYRPRPWDSNKGG
jgi:transposase-like protein